MCQDLQKSDAPVKSKLGSDDDNGDEDEGDVIKFRRTILPSSIPDMSDDTEVVSAGAVGKEKVVSKVTQAKKLLHKSIKANTHVHFGEDGADVVMVEGGVAPPLSNEGDDGEGGINLTEAQKALKKSDKLDRLHERNRIRVKHKELRAKRRQLREHPGDNEAEGGVVLAVPSDGEDEKATGGEEESDQGEEESDQGEEVEHEQRPESGPSALEDDEELALHLLQS